MNVLSFVLSVKPNLKWQINKVMENIFNFTLIIIIIIFSVLQIILFFKFWKMTNDISKMRSIIEHKIKQETETNKIPLTHKAKEIDTPKGKWGKDVTDEEKNIAKGLIPKLADNEIILMVKGKLVVCEVDELSEIDDYKVIFYN